MRVVLLARVSRDERTQDPATQLQALRAAGVRLGWDVVAEVNLTISAWDERAAAEVKRQALEALDTHRADGLAVWALDRLCRGGIEHAFRWVRELQHRGVTFYSLQEPFLSTVDPATRELLIALLSWIAKWESERKSQRLKAKVQYKRAQSAKLGQRAIWGPGHLPTPEETTAALALREEGVTVRGISERLGLPKSTVHRLLTRGGK